MSHVDDGALHAYLDGELSPLESQDVEAHIAQCPGCRRRLEEERALIARADELLGLAAPPDRATPPFRPGDREPPVRRWWRVRLPLAWAATVVLALGAGLAVSAVKPSLAPQPVSPAPAPALAGMVGQYALTGPPVTLDSARAFLGTDPYAVPDLPVRGIYRARLIGFSGVVVEQALDSSTVIAVITGRQAPLSLQSVVVTDAARADTVKPAERALMGRAAATPDSLAAAERKPEAAALHARGAAANRPAAALVSEVRGPLSAHFGNE